MSEITFNQDQKARMVSKIKRYFENELQQDIGGGSVGSGLAPGLKRTMVRVDP